MLGVCISASACVTMFWATATRLLLINIHCPSVHIFTVKRRPPSLNFKNRQQGQVKSHSTWKTNESSVWRTGIGRFHRLFQFSGNEGGRCGDAAVVTLGDPPSPSTCLTQPQDGRHRARGPLGGCRVKHCGVCTAGRITSLCI